MKEMNKNRIGNFVEGNNSLAFWVAMDIINGSLRYNPTYFYGETCSGKTLLLKGIEKEFRKKYPEKKVVYWDSEAYVNTFIRNLRAQESKRLYEFKRRNRSADILIFDDFSFLLSGNKTASLQCFFQMINELYMNQKQIIIAGHIPPRDMDIDSRYRSRLSMGLVCGLERPNEITRLEILEIKAMEKNIRLNSEILKYIADCVQNAGALSGALNRISILDNHEISQLNVERVKELLAEIINPEKKRLTVQGVINAVSDYYQISPAVLVKKNRSSSITLMRQMAMYIAMKKVPEATYKTVGEVLGRDRSTIIYGVRSMERRLYIENETELKRDMQIICETIEKRIV